MTKRIEKAIDIFLDALNENTLIPEKCTACAVGNLVAAGTEGVKLHNDLLFDSNSKKRLAPHDVRHNDHWSYLFMTSRGKQSVYEVSEERMKLVEGNVSKTDFSLKELMEIEKVFETACYVYRQTCKNCYGFYDYTNIHFKEMCIAGLAAVVELMMTFDDVKDQKVEEVFTNKAKKNLQLC